MQSSDAAALAALDAARSRVRRIAAELSDARRRAATLDDDTRWTARAADEYRSKLAAWREGLASRAAELDVLDDDLRDACARLEAKMAAEAAAGAVS